MRLKRSPAAGAPQQPLEVVLVLALARALAAVMDSEHALDAVKHFWRGERLVAAGVLLALVFNEADVVAVGQDVVYL
jgi:hypothetical protein